MENEANRIFWELYNKYVTNLKVRGKEWRGRCPFHKEKTPGAFAINAETGQYFCHSCGEKGNAVSFARFFGEDEVPYYSNLSLNKISINMELVERLHASFQDSFPQLLYNWNDELVRVLKIGYDESMQKIVFPIFGEDGNIKNLKYHKGKQTPGSKISLYPLKLVWNYNDDYVVVCEGEKDCITLLSYKIQAITGTGGAINIPKDLSALDKFLHIYICFDNDETGITGAEKWAQVIKKLKAPKIVHIADIGRIVKDGSDVTDYFQTIFKDRELFIHEILDRSKIYKPFADIPDFVRRIMLSERFQELSMRDHNVFTTLVMRVSRFYTKTQKIRGKKINIGPGQFYTSIKRLQSCCASDISEKQVRSALESLQEKGFIESEDLKAKRGRLITVLEWEDGNGQPNRQYSNGLKFQRKYPFLRSVMDFNNINTEMKGGSDAGSIKNNSSHKRLNNIFNNNSYNSKKNKKEYRGVR